MTTGEALVAEARTHIGAPYVWATAGPDTFDCSGFVHYVTSRVLGPDRATPRDSAAYATVGTPMPTLGACRPGDILCYRSTIPGRSAGEITHVGIYSGNGKMVNALNEDAGVVESDVTSRYWTSRFLYGQRREEGTMATYDPSNPIAGASLGTPNAWIAYFRDHGAKRMDEVEKFVREVYRIAPAIGIGAHKVIAQAVHETDGFTSEWWVSRLNPAGIGITGDPRQNAASKTFRDGTEAARAQLVHICLYVFGSLPALIASYRGTDPRADAIPADALGQRTTLESFGSASRVTWAADPNYGTAWARRLNELEPVFTGVPAPAPTDPAPVPGDGTGGTTPTPSTKPYLTSIPGVPGGPVPTIAPVKIKLIPSWRTNNRPGISARQPRRSVQHGNGNPNSTAAGEANYLYTGADGRQASYHSSTDDRETWVMVPGNEVTWQAADGAGPGNMNGVSNEMVEDADIWADPDRRMAVIRNTADFMGTVAGARFGATSPEQHWTFNVNDPNRHDCPDKLRHVWIGGRLAWDIYADLWHAARRDELARMAGGVAVDPGVIEIGDTLQALVRLNVRQKIGTAAPILGTLDTGTEVVVNGRWESADGYGWLPVHTPLGDGVVAQGDADGPYLQKIRSAPTPAPQPSYATPLPVEELLDTDLARHDTAAGITTAHETAFIFVADVIEFTDETNAMQYAPGGPSVKADYQTGDRAIAAWLVKAVDDQWYYLLAGGDDEWVRVPYANTTRVSDAPLIPARASAEQDAA